MHARGKIIVVICSKEYYFMTRFVVHVSYICARTSTLIVVMVVAVSALWIV
jgi:hypothetical protein